MTPLLNLLALAGLLHIAQVVVALGTSNKDTGIRETANLSITIAKR